MPPKNRADWVLFSREARPIIAGLCHGQTYAPSTILLRDLKLSWIPSAAARYHGGYRKSLKRWRLAKLARHMPPHALSKRKVVNGSGRRYSYWTREDVQRDTLQQRYADDLAWGRMPSSVKVSRRDSGLALHWLRSAEGWKGPEKKFKLLNPVEGRRQQALFRAIDEALSFFEKHRRWPVQTECSFSLRNFKFAQSQTWDKFVSQSDFHPRIMERLAIRWRQHSIWAERGNLVSLHLNALKRSNNFISAILRAEPFGRPI